MKGRKNNRTIDRRKFVGNTVKFVTLGSLLMPIVEGCNSKKSTKTVNTGTDTLRKKTSNRSTKQPRKKWTHESLVINTKTNTMHFPTSKLYTYYDEIKPNHLLEVNLAAWGNKLDEQARFNKEQSGNIIEILTVKDLKGEINDSSLIIAIDTLSTAFRSEYETANSRNFRLHELMLQLIALNNAIPADQKWTTFTAKVKRPAQLRKRQDWMSTETNFTNRVNYILQNRNDYIARLNKRASKYSFT